MDKIEVTFTSIYRRNIWGNGESRSGPGSTLRATATLRRNLPAMFDAFGIETVFDAPCGDFNWMRALLRTRKLDYTGGDVVAEMIEKLKANDSSITTRFAKLDITRDAHPRADLWLCRDCLFHLPFRESFEALRRFLESKTRYILTTTHLVDEGYSNRDIRIGDFREIDLFSPPYDFPRQTLWRIDDSDEPGVRKAMYLWSRDQIGEVLRNKTKG